MGKTSDHEQTGQDERMKATNDSDTHDPHVYDMAIVGAGPIGLEIASVMKRAGVDYVHFEKGQIGASMMWWPRNTVFFSSPEWIAIAGVPIHTAGQEQITGESYLAYLRTVVETLDLDVKTYEAVEDITGTDGDFTLSTRTIRGAADYKARKVVLAVGDMAKPKHLGLEGEDLPHVTHYFTEPHAYFRNKLVIIGGKNSALEAAIRSWRAGADVTICYRRPQLEKNRTLSRLHLESTILINRGKMTFYGETVPTRFTHEGVWVRHAPWHEPAESTESAGPAESVGFTENTEEWLIPADFVLVATGFEPDERLYDTLGIELTGPRHRPVLDADTLESSRHGIHVAGTATAGNQERYTTFITTCHDHGLRVLRHLRAQGLASEGDEPPVGNLPLRQFPLDPEDIE